MKFLARWRRSRLSETCRALLWLWENDPDGWVIGTHAVMHPGSRVGVWTANSVYGLHVEYNCDLQCAREGHMRGREIRFSKRDRRSLYRAMGHDLLHRKHGGPIPFAISEWAMKGDKFGELVR